MVSSPASVSDSEQQQPKESDAAAGKRKSSSEEAEKTEKRMKSSEADGVEQVKQVPDSESLPAVSSAAPASTQLSPQHHERPAWWLPGNFLTPPPPLFERETTTTTTSTTATTARQVLIRPTSVPHDKSLFFRSEATCSADGLPGPALDVSMFNSRLIGCDQGGGDIGGRKSFVEWRPMVSNTAWNHLRPQEAGVSNWMAPNLNLPPSTGEERQFLGPTDRDRPLGTSQAQENIPVVVEGRSAGGSICLHQYDGYPSFAGALRSMLSQNSSSSSSMEQCSLSDVLAGYIVAYEDEEGDLLLAGDLSWRSFVRRAKRIRVLVAKGRRITPVP